MKDRFDVQLGVARPVEPRPAARPEGVPKPAADSRPDPVAGEYRSRGVPAYLVPPFLILLAALGIMSYQNVSASLPLRAVARPGAIDRSITSDARQTDTGPTAADEKVDTAQAVVAREPEKRATPRPRPSIPERAKPAIEVVETSAARPAATVVSPAPESFFRPQALFEHDTVAGLRPVGAGALEPPLVAPPLRP